MDLLRLHVVWDAKSLAGAEVAERISRHFDGIGMERDGVAYRVPVRFASAPWTAGTTLPKPVDLTRAHHNAIVLLHDEEMHQSRGDWSTWVAELRSRMAKRGDEDIYIAFGSPSGERPLSSDEADRIQYARRKSWRGRPSDETQMLRLLLLTLLRIRSRLRELSGRTEKEPIFVSHAKADGDASAKAIVDYVNDSTDGVPLETFYDATELLPGENYEDRFAKEIVRATLLAIVSDVYETRPWCVFELTEAKRHCRPIVLIDIGSGRTSRTYPYGANLPRVRMNPIAGDHQWIEQILVEAMSEGLRCDLFQEQASKSVRVKFLGLPRPPELFDIIHRDGLPGLIVYPDPPLGKIEADLISRALAMASPGTRLSTLGELS